MLKSRFLYLDELMTSAGVDAVVVNPGPTLTYLTGLHFHLMERPTLLFYARGQQPHLIFPELEAAKIQSLSIPMVVHPYTDDPSKWQSAFDQALLSMRTKPAVVGVEANHMRFMELTYLRNALQRADFVAAEDVFDGLRLYKDNAEIESMRKAVRIAEEAFTALLAHVKPGVSEHALASELILQLYKAGSEPELPFMPIIASGANSANPHATPSARTLNKGDLIVIDWGASCSGYLSDLTRTVALGEPTAEMMAVYQAVKAANAAGSKMVKPGIRAGDVDSAARHAIDTAGYAPYFTHRTGHGLGMEAHEPPYIFGANDLVLRSGMTFTVEPGIYLPDRGGVRIEDDVLVTKDGCESLSSLSRELIIL